MYSIWSNIKTRCYNENCRSYKDYGARGISMCYDWQKSFENFFIWAMENGYRDDLTIDRIDVNGHYEPENCRWATKSLQSFNQRPVKHSTAYTGISYKKRDNIYSVDICYEHLGSTRILEEAIEMRREAEIEKFGFTKIGVESRTV